MSTIAVKGSSVEYLNPTYDEEVFIAKHDDGRYSFSVRRGEDWIDVVVTASDFENILEGMKNL